MSTQIQIVSSGSSGITVGTTTITGGFKGGVLFDDSGIVQENVNLKWSNSLNALAIGYGISNIQNARLQLTAIGPLSTDGALRVWNSTMSNYLLNVNGDGSVGIGAYGNAVAKLWVAATGTYGIYSAVTGSHYAMYLASPNVNVNHGYYCASIGAAAGFKCEDPGGGSGTIKVGFQADSFGVNDGGTNIGFSGLVNPTTTGTNIGLKLQVQGSSTANYAIQIMRGDINIVASKIGVTTGDKLAFWGSTPITQPTTAVSSSTLVSVGGANIQKNDTFDGYTIGQVVNALRTIGLLA